jgi:hypothetical protein
LFGAVLGNYGLYYQGRKWQELLEQNLSKRRNAALVREITLLIWIYMESLLMQTVPLRFFLLIRLWFLLPHTATIPESDNLMGVIAIGLSIFFFFPQKFNLPKPHKV